MIRPAYIPTDAGGFTGRVNLIPGYRIFTPHGKLVTMTCLYFMLPRRERIRRELRN